MSGPTEKIDWRPGAQGRKLALRLGLVLGGLLALPVVGLLILEGGVIAGCKTESVGSGVLEGNIAWRIDKSICRASKAPYYDVALGARDKPMATALVASGAPVPIAVARLPDGNVGVKLDRPWPGANADNVISIRMRKSGSPAERVDLQAPGGAPPAVSPELSGRAR
jgi:hypothetical protein